MNDFEGGQIAASLKIFQEPRANDIFYQYVPRFRKGISNYVAFSPIAKLTFEPGLLIISAKDSQAEMVMKAMTYSTGESYDSRSTPVMGCARLYIYPCRNGKVNSIIPSMIHGMDGRGLFPEGTILISIPDHWTPIITRNLKEIDWNPPSHQGREKFLPEFERVMGKLVP